MTGRHGAVEFRILGPLEVLVGGVAVPVGGAKQRAVLAALLLRAGEVVPVERLIDEVWGESPPPSAAHSLEAYVSRLRQLLNGHGPSLLRRGTGYVLVLSGSTLDADEFEALTDEGWSAAAAGRFRESSRLGTQALELWRGPALADVALASSGRSEAERLEELRLRTFEQLFDAELALGHHQAIVGKLQTLVGQNPYRERFVAQLMLALYRGGRHADALDAYEQTRRRLDEDLGLQPSVELQQLSGQIVRQDPELRWLDAAPRAQIAARAIGGRARRLTELVLVGAATAAVMAFTASGSTPSSNAGEATAAKRVALVVPSSPRAATSADPRLYWSLDAFRTSTSAWGHDAEVIVSDENAPTATALETTLRRIEHGGFDLVLVLGGGATARAIADDLVRERRGTRFGFVDTSLSTLSLEGVENATATRFAEEEASVLAGYISGLVAPRGASAGSHADMVSVVAGERSARTRMLVAAFRKGARRARAEVTVRVDYANELVDPTRCEQLANRQIDRGSDVVYALAGECGLGALAVAQLRGVWAIRSEENRTPKGPHILATTVKYWASAMSRLINEFELDTLPEGEDRVLGLDDDYAVMIETASVVDPVWSKVVDLCTEIRAQTRAAGT